MQKEIMNLRETAEYLNVGMTSIRQLVRRSDVNFAFRIGAKWLVRRDALDKWITLQSRRC